MTTTKIFTHPFALLTQSTLAGNLIVYSENLLQSSVKWIIPVLFAVLVDLIWGVQAAKQKGERVTISKAIRSTVTKLIAYACWIIFAVSCCLSFSNNKIAIYAMSIILANEAWSAINNYLRTKGKKLNLQSVLSVVGEKIGLKTLKDITVEDIEQEKNKNG